MTWPPPGRITGCDRCDDHDVEVPGTLYYVGRDLHRAWHEVYRPAETFLRARLYEPLARTLEG